MSKIKSRMSKSKVPSQKGVLIAAGGIAAGGILAVLLIPAATSVGKTKAGGTTTIVSTLENIINVSDLSTYTAVYNGIAEVKESDDPDEVAYYVAYEAEVDAGIDFQKVAITADDEAKEICITLPEVEITDIVVDIASLDYIFLDDKANTSTVSQEAYRACELDVEKESKEQKAICELAAENAKNVIKALSEPIVEQLYPEYQISME